MAAVDPEGNVAVLNEAPGSLFFDFRLQNGGLEPVRAIITINDVVAAPYKVFASPVIVVSSFFASLGNTCRPSVNRLVIFGRQLSELNREDVGCDRCDNSLHPTRDFASHDLNVDLAPNVDFFAPSLV